MSRFHKSEVEREAVGKQVQGAGMLGSRDEETCTFAFFGGKLEENYVISVEVR